MVRGSWSVVNSPGRVLREDKESDRPSRPQQRRVAMAIMMETPAPPSFDWKRWPDTEAFVAELIATAREGNAFARELAGRMPREAGTPLTVWVDHLVVSGGQG